MTEKKLAYSVYVPDFGRTYPAGATAGQIGKAAEKIGDHAWEGAEASEDESTVGTALGDRNVLSQSGLPGGDVTTSVPLVSPDGDGVDQETVEARLTPAATVPDGMGGDATTPIPGVTAETVEAADGDADAAKAEGSDKAPDFTATATANDTGSTTPAKKAAAAKRTGSRSGSGS